MHAEIIVHTVALKGEKRSNCRLNAGLISIVKKEKKFKAPILVFITTPNP